MRSSSAHVRGAGGLGQRQAAGLPLSGPVHQVVAGQQGRQPEEDLALGAAEGVEDGVVGGTGKGVLTVGSNAVGDDALDLASTTCVQLVCHSRSIHIQHGEFPVSFFSSPRNCAKNRGIGAAIGPNRSMGSAGCPHPLRVRHASFRVVSRTESTEIVAEPAVKTQLASPSSN